MRNRYLENFDNVVKIKIVGNNVSGYLKRIFKDKIQIKRIIPVSRKEVYVILKYSEYQKLLEYRSIYEVSVVRYYGRIKILKKIRESFAFLLFLVMGIFLIFFLSRVIFFVEVVHSDKEIRNLVRDELSNYGIKRYSFRKSYYKLEEIEDKILNDNKERLEWIEIVSYGTKYTVRVEERKINKEDSLSGYQSIVSRKNAVIVEIDALRGEKVKSVNDFVSKGDTIISGYITLPDNTKVLTQALGKVWGEVWYTVDIDYPYVYQESNFTGRNKIVYALYFFNKRFGLFDFEKYRLFKLKDKVLVSSNFLDIRFVLEKQYEVDVLDEVYTEDMVMNKAIGYVKDKMLKDNPSIREVSDVKIIDSFSDEKGGHFKMFVSAIEDIGVVSELVENIE